jgi:dihydrofolate reductase
MGKLIYLLNVSLDGYVETPDHSLDWSVVDDELHTWFNDRTRELDASIYGRGLYETMSGHWPTAEADPSLTGPEREFAEIWLAMPKIVFSRSLDSVGWNSRLVRGDVDTELAKVKAEFDGDIAVGGATLGASFIRRGLIDEYRLVVHPVILGAGTPFFPALDQPIRLRPIEEHTFASGVRYLAYAAE